MRLKSIHLAPIIVGVFILGIAGTSALNLWKTESSKVPAVYAEGNYAGEFNPADIRGSYTFGDIEEVFGFPAEILARAFGITGTGEGGPEDGPASFQVKELEEGGEIGTDAVRLFVARYTGLPYVPEEDTVLPPAAAAILEERMPESVPETETVRDYLTEAGGEFSTVKARLQEMVDAAE